MLQRGEKVKTEALTLRRAEQLALMGITAATIIMSGGRSGPTATPVTFTLANVVQT